MSPVRSVTYVSGRTLAVERFVVKLSIRIDFGPELRVGPGKIALLEAIDAHGSISAAARAMDMSYRRAWELVEDLNRLFGQDVAAPKSGGKKGGGATLTATGRDLVARYRAMEKAAIAATLPELAAIASQTVKG
jgi:molybdate transport system regulatory protein